VAGPRSTRGCLVGSRSRQVVSRSIQIGQATRPHYGTPRPVSTRGTFPWSSRSHTAQMPLRPAPRPKRLYRQIADQIARLIEKGEYPVGSRLPSEREIADRLSVSRASVREAIIALEIGGQVEVRGGSGIYVREAE